MTENELKYIDDRIEKYTKIVSEVLLLELQDVKTNIKEVRDEFKKMNGTLRNVCEWKESHQSMHNTEDKGRDSNLKVAGVVIAFLAMSSGWVFGFANMTKKVDVLKQNLDRQDRYLQWKFGETPVNPTTRGRPLDFSKINLKDTANGRHD